MPRKEPPRLTQDQKEYLSKTKVKSRVSHLAFAVFIFPIVMTTTFR